MSGAGQVFTGLLLIVLWAAPVFLARLFADTLDRAPYAISLAVGVGVALIVGGLCWQALRSGLAGDSTARARAAMMLVALGFCPTWFTGLGLGINRVFDRSAPIAHACRVLDWRVAAKGPARCLVSSWRGRQSETLSHAQVLSEADDRFDEGRVPARCAPGRALEVSTRAGALGWEWITDVRPL